MFHIQILPDTDRRSAPPLSPWIRSAILIFALLLAIAAAAIQGIHAFWAALLLAAAVASLIAEIAIEPASANIGRD